MPDGNKLFRNQFYEICKTQKKKTAITYIKKDQTLVECSYEQMKDGVEISSKNIQISELIMEIV